MVAEVETDKATMEMEAFDDGILHKHLVAAGTKIDSVRPALIRLSWTGRTISHRSAQAIGHYFREANT